MVVRVEWFFVTKAMQGCKGGVILCYLDHDWL